MSISTFSPVILHEASYVDEVTRFVAHRYATSGYKKVDDADALLQALENEDRLLAPLSTIATMNDDSGRLLCTARVIIRTTRSMSFSLLNGFSVIVPLWPTGAD